MDGVIALISDLGHAQKRIDVSNAAIECALCNIRSLRNRCSSKRC